MHEWLPRTTELPERCAGCKSHNWNKKLQVEKK